MFQREVAERIVAEPGSKAYGRLAVLAQWRTDARIVMSLPPGAFTPPPKVSSAVVRLTALPEPKFPADPKVLERVVAMAFNQRRKMLRSALKGLHPDVEDLLESAGISPDRPGGARVAREVLRACEGCERRDLGRGADHSAARVSLVSFASPSSESDLPSSEP